MSCGWEAECSDSWIVKMVADLAGVPKVSVFWGLCI